MRFIMTLKGFKQHNGLHLWNNTASCMFPEGYVKTDAGFMFLKRGFSSQLVRRLNCSICHRIACCFDLCVSSLQHSFNYFYNCAFKILLISQLGTAEDFFVS